MVRTGANVTLIDTGIGLQDIADPERRIGREAISAAGFQFSEVSTAARQLEVSGFSIADVSDIVLTHADPDHAGGLADFPQSSVHLSAEELRNIESRNPRYSPPQFEHDPAWVEYAHNDGTWFGLPSRRLHLQSEVEVHLIPLFGHTFGHCGVAIATPSGWILHAGDTYYLRAELANAHHPIDALAQLRADDDASRRRSLDQLRRVLSRHDHEVECFGYHDTLELPPSLTPYEVQS